MFRRILYAVFAALPLVVFSGGAAQAAPLRVVTTLSTFADLVWQIGGEQVKVDYIASPRFNPHFIEPKPSDVLKVKRADLFVHAGLDLELWRWPLVDAAGNPEVRPGGKRELDLSKGIPLLEIPQGPVSRAEGDIHIYGNPHYWLDPENVRIMAGTIQEKLAQIDPDRAGFYRSRLDQFLKKLDEESVRWKQQLQAFHGMELISYHRSWPYLAKFAGLKIEQFLEPKPGIPPTPKQLAFLEEHIARNKIKAIIQETFVPKAASQALSKKTGVRVVILCQNVKETKEVSDYVGLMDYNVRELVKALGK
ncbi:MAG: metal ABC transporter substrate-binding protein [Candidatus Omnitrophica bacterium]|nr:metal ABC transporter substrate-binding protein [Candidatus Omnitrophota bacterium]